MVKKYSNRIIAAHLLNDFSGSPKVLSQLLRALPHHGFEVHLFTSGHQKGFLSDLEGIETHGHWYVFANNPWIRLVNFTISQLLLFFRLLFFLRKSDVVYVNTVLPFGAAWAGKLRGCRVIYHIHESTVKPKLLKWWLFFTVEITAMDIINVSRFVEESHHTNCVKNHLVYNAIEDVFLQKARKNKREGFSGNILMVCSLKKYKGVFEFVKLAKNNPDKNFRLVINANQIEIDSFFNDTKFSDNLTVYSAQSDLHPFYSWADVIVNLSRSDGWIETFGLTIIEGMAYGLPAIVPPVGGILEVIEEGKTGFAVDSRKTADLQQALLNICGRQYSNLSKAALERVEIFSESNFILRIVQILGPL
ncbi:MAG: glycosyltransferase family 4 protein [Cryomorphaceae bacterium]|nr:glycosyltransferase family 4 protein [Cryomorphaceae bacterium]